ncbi:MAG: hypothetical protein PWQ10_437 [Patescibacteria group bacterium]|nr:hypothetical protein [Patescibacteria group bacterium]
MLLFKCKKIIGEIISLHNDRCIKRNSRIRSILLLIILLISTIIVPILQTNNVAAVTIADNQDATWQIQSLMYYETITKCMETAHLSGSSVFNILNADDAKSGKWFDKGTTEWMGVYMRDTPTDSDPMEIGEDGIVGCENPSLINGALAHWGLEDDKLRVLCKSGFARTNQGALDSQPIEDCANPEGTDNFTTALSSTIIASRFKNYIREVVYNSKTPALTDAQLYMFYRHSLNESCIKGIDSTEPDNINRPETNKKAYNDVKWVYTKDDGTADIKTGSYLGSLDYQTYIHLRINEGMTCYNIKNKMNSYADAFIKWSQSHPVESKAIIEEANDTTTISDHPTCSASVASLGWLICPIIDILTNLNNLMWNLVSSLLKVNPLEQGDSNTIYMAWGSIRNISNVVFVIIFLIMIFSQLSSAGISNYGIKKLLPKLIVGAILVNLSFIIVQILVDLSNIIGSSLYTVILSITPTIFVLPSWNAIVNILLTAGAGGAVTIAGIIIAGGPAALLLLLLPVALMGMLGLLAAVLTLIFRQAIIPILAIIAPLAFIAYLLPNTESWFKKWKDLLISMLMLYPLASIVFGGSRFAASAIVGENGANDWLKNIIGLLVLSLPLFSLPFLASKGGSILNKVNGALRGIADKARKPLNDWASSHRELAKANYLNANPNKKMRFTRRAARSIATKRAYREAKTEAANEEFKNQGLENKITNTTGKKTIDLQESSDALNAAKRRTAINSKESDTRVLSNPKNIDLHKREYESNLKHDEATGKIDEKLKNDKSFDYQRAATETAKTMADTATKKSEERVERSNGMLQVRARNTAAVGDLDKAKGETKRDIAEAATYDGTQKSLDRMSGGAQRISRDVMGELHTNVIEKNIISSAESAATNLQNQQVAETIIATDANGKTSQEAIRSAGVAGDPGIARILAGARAGVAKVRSDNVTTAASSFTAEGYGVKDYIRVIKEGKLKNNDDASSEDIEAAINNAVRSGHLPTVEEVVEQLVNPKEGSILEEDISKFQQAFAAATAGSSNKLKMVSGSVLDEFKRGEMTTPPIELLKAALMGKKYSMNTYADMDSDELDLTYKFLTGKNIATGEYELDPNTAPLINELDEKDALAMADTLAETLEDPMLKQKVAPREINKFNKIMEAVYARYPGRRPEAKS